ncbi:reverse transcriptase domain-containing protein [Tanacetum coccineum]
MNYLILKKLALALVHTSRRLCRYFQAHAICVLTDQPIRQVLLRPENSGRLAKWAIELGEHDISYKPRSSIKGQVIVDFLAECPNNISQKEPKKKDRITPEAHHRTPVWTLYTDGASSNEGAGAGLILTDPEGNEITFRTFHQTRGPPFAGLHRFTASH